MSNAKYQSEPVLVGDIGGTNARFALAETGTADGPLLSGIRRYAATQFESLEAAINHYLQEMGPAAMPGRGVMAVAAPVTGDTVQITNNPWVFSIRELRQHLNLESLDVINDFTANSLSLPYLKAADVRPIGDSICASMTDDGAGSSDRTYAIIGPGTGLGVGALLLRGGRTTTVDSEGGHISFAPGNAYEIQILERLLEQFERVSYERLISGSGLINLYRAVCAVEGVTPIAQTPEDITRLAGRNQDDIPGRTMYLFGEILGACAGDVALAFGAWDGVYLAGGMLGTLLPWLTSGGFRRRFEAKGRFRPALQATPTLAILHPDIGLLGAAAHAAENPPNQR